MAQRMLAARNETHATGATLLFNVAHYALRPWPWILVALCSIVIFPDLESLKNAFPHLPENVVKDDLAYPAMMTLLPRGLRGLVLASLIAAFMSTLSTHLNWGSSYVVNDFYKRFIRRDASEKHLVLAGRLCTLLTMVAAALLGLALSNALQVFRILLQVGAGTGLLFLLRWFWWRINAFSEIAAMVISFVVALSLEFFAPSELPGWAKLLLGVGTTTVGWLSMTYLTRPTDEKTLRRFCRQIRPGGPGWTYVLRRAAADGEPVDDDGAHWTVPIDMLCMVIGCTAVYSALLGTGYWIYGRRLPAVICTSVAALSIALLMIGWTRWVATRLSHAGPTGEQGDMPAFARGPRLPSRRGSAAG